MATLVANSALQTAYSGQHGNLSVAHGTYTLASASAADKIRILKLFAGTKITDLKIIFADLGTGGTVDVGFEYVNGESGGVANQFFNDLDTDTAAGSAYTASVPVTLAYDAYIIVTRNTAAGTGKVDVIVNYEFKGA